MPVDMDLALNAGMNAFARVMFIKPLASQPGEPVYMGRAASSVRPVDIALEGGAVLSSQETKLGIRFIEYAIPPAPGDQVSIDGGATWYWIDDIDPDSENLGGHLALKAVDPS